MAFILSLAFCFEAPTAFVTMAAAGTAGGAAVAAAGAAEVEGAVWAASVEAAGAWLACVELPAECTAGEAEEPAAVPETLGGCWF